MVGLNEAVTNRSGPIVPFSHASSKTRQQNGLRSRGRMNEPYLMLARYNYASIARFMSVDPESAITRASYRPQAWNQYGYVYDSPLRYQDGTGRCPIDVFSYLQGWQTDVMDLVDANVIYGNYGGLHWTGGKWNGTDYSVQAYDSLDELFKEHDQAYDACTASGGDPACVLAADQTLLTNLKNLDTSEIKMRGKAYRKAAIAVFTAKTAQEDNEQKLEEIVRRMSHCGPDGCLPHPGDPDESGLYPRVH